MRKTVASGVEEELAKYLNCCLVYDLWLLTATSTYESAVIPYKVTKSTEHSLS
jgi:hypothetical protein